MLTFQCWTWADKIADSVFLSSSHSHAQSLQATPQPEPQALPAAQPVAETPAESFILAGGLLPDTPVDPPSLQPQSFTASAPAAEPTAPSQSSSGQTPPLRQRLGEDLYRLVQVSPDWPEEKLWTQPTL